MIHLLLLPLKTLPLILIEGGMVMENINIGDFLGEFFLIIMFLAGVITTVGGAITVIKKMWASSKANRHVELIKSHTEQILNLNSRVEKLENKTVEQDRFISVMCNAMLALLDFNINGDTTDKLRHAKEDMQEFLIHRG